MVPAVLRAFRTSEIKRMTEQRATSVSRIEMMSAVDTPVRSSSAVNRIGAMALAIFCGIISRDA